VIGGGRVVAQGAKSELLASTGTLARGLDAAELHVALAEAGLEATPGSDGALLVDAEPEAVGRAAAAAGVVLCELRPADGAGLEDLFLSLTRQDRVEVAA
jgi:ABC-2 type transport system ATP-binding protein